jgi:hypothetical protein
MPGSAHWPATDHWQAQDPAKGTEGQRKGVGSVQDDVGKAAIGTALIWLQQ